jgi:hypothetical protein
MRRLVGNISILWRDIQEHHYRGLEQRYSSRYWKSMLIQKLWQVEWDQWDHMHGILHGHEHLVMLAEVVVIKTHVKEELVIGIQGILSGGKYLFQEHCVTMTLDWQT